MQVSINQFFKGPNGTKDRERTYLLFIWVETFRLGLRFKPLEPPTTPILRPLDSNWDLTISSPVSQAFGLNYPISLPASLACSWQIVGLLGLHNCVSMPIINVLIYLCSFLSLYIYTILVLFFWKTPTNIEIEGND